MSGYRRGLDARIRTCDCGHRALLPRPRPGTQGSIICPVCGSTITTIKGN